MRHPFKISILLFIAAVIFLLFVQTSIIRAQTYNFENYTIENGLPQNTILSICQDKSGYIWFGTNNGGASKFDGKNFITYTENDGLANNVVFSIIQARNNSLFLGTNGGLSVFEGSKFRNFTTENGLPHNRVFSVLESKRTDFVWIGTQNGVVKYRNRKIESCTNDSILNKASVFTLFEDTKGNIWFGTISNGAIKFDGKNYSFYTTSNGLLHSFVRTITEDDKGNIWIGTAKGLNVIDKEGTVSFRKVQENETTLTVTSSLKAANGSLWLGTEYGVLNHSDRGFKRYIQNNGLPGNKILSAMQDSEGNIWFGSEGKGVIKFRSDGNLFTTYTQKNGLSNEIVTSIYQDKQGTMWYGSHNGICLNKKDSFEFLQNYEDGINIGIAQKAFNFIEDNEENLWIGTTTKGIFKIKNRKIVKNYNSVSPEQKLGHVYSSIKLLDGSIWFGTDHGIVKIWNDSISGVDFLKDASIWDMLSVSNKEFWFATSTGVAKHDGKAISYYRKKDGFVDGKVRTIVRDKSGNLWFATDEGIFRYNGRKFEVINKQNGLVSTTIYLLLLDKSDRLWAGSENGLDRIDIAAYNKTGEIKIKHFGKEEGFIGLECNTNAAFEDAQGRLWFGTVQGVTVMDPLLEVFNTMEPSTKITNIRFEFENYDWAAFSDSIEKETKLPVNLVLPYDKNHLTFDFIGISHTSPDKVKYKYQLTPLNKNWFPLTSKNEAVYSHIPPGEYTFRVMAMNNDGVWNKTPVEFSFTVLPPWYQTWWFYSSIIGLIAISIYSFISLRTQNLRKQKFVLEKEVRLRTSELREEKEKVEEINQEVIHKNKIIGEKNRDITDSINYAKRIQEALLPVNSKLQESFKNCFILYTPKDIVSGDFYWCGIVDERAYIAAVDCTGHGVPGAFMSMIGHNLLNEIVLRDKIVHPGEILKHLNNNLKQAIQSREIETQDGMDMAICCVTEGHLEYAGANNPLWIIRNNKLTEVKASKRPIGGITESDYEFENHRIELQEGDSIYICSDGYQDQFGGPHGKKFMTKRLKLLLEETCSLTSKQQHETLKNTLRDWMGEKHEQVDDVLVIGLKF